VWPGLARITGEIVVDAAADLVFDFGAGQRNEPSCTGSWRNPQSLG
jgi:hypothetical protein